MDLLQYRDYEGSTEIDAARDVCRGRILFINDLVTYEADSVRQLRKEFEAAVDDYIETCRLVGKEPQRPFKGLFNVRVSPELHRAAVVRATREGTTLNDVVVQALSAHLQAPVEINHNLKLTIESTSSPAKTVAATASGGLTWVPSNVH